ncbi:hypothetical protein [Paraburkholderia sp.]|uniref:hypothetical protein n=1 Tax=Paraburkholderia sp. TaxID=1926495 RepID=UPI00239F7A79|nr:hypothetical protein [Paraburkholderia sp.]MDE1180355.1 hypothetical protein [Paraburkholderia sp.]
MTPNQNTMDEPGGPEQTGPDASQAKPASDDSKPESRPPPAPQGIDPDFKPPIETDTSKR